MTTVWTIGHSNRSLEAFAELLAAAGIRRLVDVRRFPVSRRHPWFAGEALAAGLAERGVLYLHAEDLGGHRRAGTGARHAGLHAEAFRAYAAHMEGPAFRRALARLLALAAERPTAVSCAEARWRDCHRSLLADALVAEGARVVHLGVPDAGGGSEEHALHPAARHGPRGLVYDAAPRQLDLFGG